MDSLNGNRTLKAFLESSPGRLPSSAGASKPSLAGTAVAVLHFGSLEVLKCHSYQQIFKM